MPDYQKFIKDLVDLPKEEQTPVRLREIKRDFCKKYKLTGLPANTKLLREYRYLLKNGEIEKSEQVEIILRKRAIRSQSGIVSVQVLTKPFPCPGKCIFCPSEVDMPKSYLKSEPGAMRAWLNHFDPHKQVWNRLLSLTQTGHQTDKIEMIVLWWTWDVYPDDYKIEFVKWLYDACNTFPAFFERVEYPDENDDKWKTLNWNTHNKKFSFHVRNVEEIKHAESLENAMKINEKSANRIIGLTIETRPEFVTDKNCLFWRRLGVTRIEMGIQSLYDDILEANKRGHDVECIRKAMHKLRQYWFKVSVHIMPGLYKSNKEKDLWTFERLYSDPFLKPDEIKFYPTSVIPRTELNELYEKWEYKPLETQDIKDLIEEVLLEIIPPYTRIKRLIRDIPATEIVAGSKVTNLSQLARHEIKWKMIGEKNKIRKFYNRLYGEYKLFEDFHHFELDKMKSTRWITPLAWEKVPWGKSPSTESTSCKGISRLRSRWRSTSVEMTRDIETYIVWKNPDLEWFREFVSLDTRSREIRNRLPHPGEEILEKHKSKFVNQIIRVYESSVGREFFVSFEDEFGYLYGFTRLLLPKDSEIIEVNGLGQNTAIIRELHVYGKLESLQANKWSINEWIQHQWFGKQLMQSAEKIAKSAWYKKLSVISWVGVREYYEKLGYELNGTYMVKKVKKM